jgi:Ca2+-binding EF-hand superfamily protein
MKIKSTILLILAAAILPMTAQAQPQGGKGKRPNPGEMFKNLDTDESGTISKDEAKGPLAEHFEDIDADGNGELTKEELRAAREKRGGKGKDKLREADSDGNGAISTDEAEAAGLQRIIENFDKLDADGNGEISREEFKEARGAHGGRDGGGRQGEGRK